MNDLSVQIYKSSPKPLKSIQIEMPEVVNKSKPNDEIFMMLLEIFHNGMVKFYSNECNIVNLDTITEDNLLNIRKYFWSFGFDIFYRIYDLQNNLLKQNKNYTNPTELNNKYLDLKTDNLRYRITFDYYQEG